MIKVLYILHAYFNRAGTEMHAKVLAKNLAVSQESFFLSWNGDKLSLIKDDKAIKEWKLNPLGFPETPLKDLLYEKAIQEAISFVKPNLVHVHHLHHLPLSVMEVLTTLKLPWLYSLHDYYLVTPHFTMQGIMDPRVTLGPNYATKVFGKDISKYLQERRAYIAHHLQGAKALVAPSQYAQMVHNAVFPDPIRVIEHGIVPFNPVAAAGHSFGFIGSLLPQKGIDSLVHAYLAYRKQGGSYPLNLFGGKLSQEIPGIIQHGVYNAEDLPKIAEYFSVGIIPSVFPETFCLTLSELWQMRKPVIVSGIGALHERMKRCGGGYVYKPGDVAALAGCMMMVEKNGVDNRIVIPQVKTAEAMAQEYAALYKEVL